MDSLIYQIFLCRYRIDGAVLRAAVALGSVNLPVDSAPNSTVNLGSQRPRLEAGVTAEDDKSTKTPPPADVFEILRRWTHAMEAVHKQTLRLVIVPAYNRCGRWVFCGLSHIIMGSRESIVWSVQKMKERKTCT
jgi:hypothetical protein